jgi:hypothetical protein
MIRLPRTAILAGLLAGAFVLTAAAPPSAAAEMFDWVLMAVDVPAGTRGMSLGVFMYGVSDADHIPLALAVAMPGSGWPAGGFGFDDAYQWGQYGGVEVGVSAFGVSQHVSVGVNRSTNTYLATMGIGFSEQHTAEAHTFYYLVVAPGVRATLPFASYATRQGEPLHYEATWGSGARAVRMSDLTTGVGASVGPASTGTGAAAMSLSEGIVGSFTWECVGNCEGVWHAPDGRSDTWTQAGIAPFGSHPILETSLFSGPAGAWRWDWGGSQHGESIAILAPVGDAWQYFA